MKIQVVIEFDSETGKAQVASNAPNPPMTYGAMVAAFEALMFKNIMAVLNPAGIVQPTEDDLAAIRKNGPRSGA